MSICKAAYGGAAFRVLALCDTFHSRTICTAARRALVEELVNNTEIDDDEEEPEWTAQWEQFGFAEGALFPSRLGFVNKPISRMKQYAKRGILNVNAPAQSLFVQSRFPRPRGGGPYNGSAPPHRKGTRATRTTWTKTRMKTCPL